MKCFNTKCKVTPESMGPYPRGVYFHTIGSLQGTYGPALQVPALIWICTGCLWKFMRGVDLYEEVTR